MNHPVGFGILLSVSAMLMYALMDAISKQLTVNYDVQQILAVRSWFFFAFTLFVVRRTGFIQSLTTDNVLLQISRSLILVAEIGVAVLSFSLLPLADFHALLVLAPIIVTVLSAIFLDECISYKGWISVLLGLIGALIIIRPGVSVISWTSVLPLIGAILWAVYQVLTRLVSRSDRSKTSLAYVALIGMIIFSSIAPFYWRTPDIVGWILLLTSGLLGSLAAYALMKALELAPASVLQPYNYSLLVWAVILGIIIFGDVPELLTMIGSGIIVFAGVYAIKSKPKSEPEPEKPDRSSVKRTAQKDTAI